MEHSTLGVSWNTALYSLAVAGAVTYQLWVLAEGCRRGGAGSMARQGWSAVACMAPMLVAVPHAGVIRSSMYSVAVAGLAAVTLYVQDAARRGMPWREACAVGAGNAVLAAACAAGSVAPADGVCGRPFWVWMGVVVFVSLLLAVSYAERGGRGQKAEECGDAVASVLLVTTVVVGTIGSLVCGRAYHEMYVGGGGGSTCRVMRLNDVILVNYPFLFGCCKGSILSRRQQRRAGSRQVFLLCGRRRLCTPQAQGPLKRLFLFPLYS
ncbi:DUF1686 domain-containing protein [Encephalitozoon cuniculi]|nr:DUF1686 domain-containing protein [Encephalitozoon cuniculi]